MTTINETVGKIDSFQESSHKWENDSLKMREARTWLVDQACNRILQMCNSKIEDKSKEDGGLPDEIVFEWFNVKSDLMKHCGVLVDGQYVKNATPMEYSFDTIYNGGFTSSSGKVDRNRMRRAGVANPFVLDVKRHIANKCIKVWDISDKKISNKNVWQITIFIHEIRKLNKSED